MLFLMVTRSCWQLAGACRNRTYPAPYEAELVLKTSRTTRPDPPPEAAHKLATRGPFLQLHAMNPDLRVALVCVAGLVLITYVYPVFQLKAVHRAAAQLRLLPTARERIDARFLAVIDPLIAALGHLGFTLVGYLEGPGDPAKSGIRHTIVLRTGDGTTGAVIYVAEQMRLDAVHLATGVQFSTEFTD